MRCVLQLTIQHLRVTDGNVHVAVTSATAATTGDASRVAGLKAVREATRQRASDVAPVLDANRVQVVGQRRAKLSKTQQQTTSHLT